MYEAWLILSILPINVLDPAQLFKKMHLPHYKVFCLEYVNGGYMVEIWAANAAVLCPGGWLSSSEWRDPSWAVSYSNIALYHQWLAAARTLFGVGG
jgi:hypothetical protein